MGCGKSKHAVVEATTVIKTMRSDDGKETRTTKTVTEKGGDSALVRQVETTSLVVEDTKKETVTTKIDPTGGLKMEDAPRVSGDGDGNASKAKEDDKDKDSNNNNASDENVVPALNKDDAGTTKDGEEVMNKPTNTNDVNNDGVVAVKEDEEAKKKSNLHEDAKAKSENIVKPTSSKDDVGTTTVVKQDEEEQESNINKDETKTDNMVSSSSKDVDVMTVGQKDEEKKESNINKDKTETDNMVPTSSKDAGGTTVVGKDEENKEAKLMENEAKTENVAFTSSKPVVKEDQERKETNQTENVDDAKTKNVAPTLSESAVETIEVVKVNPEFKDADNAISDEKFVTPLAGSSNPKDENPKIVEFKNPAPRKESTIAEIKKEDVKVTEADIADATTSTTVEPDTVPVADEVNVVETTEKEP